MRVFKFIWFIVFCFYMVAGGVVHANVNGTEICSFVTGGKGNGTVNISLPIVERNVAVGSVIYKKDYTYDSLFTHQGVRCGPDTHFDFDFVAKMTGSSEYGSNVYDTNLHGVGIRLSLYSQTYYYNFPQAPVNSPFTQNVDIEEEYGSAQFGTGYLHLVVELIKTSSDVEPGNLNYSISDFVNAVAGNSLVMASVNVTGPIQAEVCEFDSTTPTSLDLGNVEANELSVSGSFANEKQFQVSINCDHAANVSMTFTGTKDVNAIDRGVLALDKSSKADGVGIQLLRDNSPININEAFTLGQVNEGKTSIEMKARIYRTNEILKPGPLSAITTISLTYQ